MPIIPGIIASELSGNLQPQPPIIDTISGAVVISGGTTSGSNSIVRVFLTPNPLGQPLTNYGVTAFSGSPLVAISGSTVTGSTSPLTITYPFAANELYEFAGFANNKYGNSKYGNISNQVEPFLATATPSGLAVSGTSVSQAKFTFLQVPGSTNYVLSAVGSFTDNAGLTTNDSATLNVAGPGTSPTVTGIMNHGFFTGMPYKFYVQSQNFAGTSASGANIVLTPNPFAAPTVTPIFTTTKAFVSGNSIINVTITNPDTNPLHNLPLRYNYVDANTGFGSKSDPATSISLLNLTNPIEPVAIINVTAQGAYGDTPGTPQTLLFPPTAPASVNAAVTIPATGWTATSGTATVNVTWSQTVNTQYSQPTSYTITASGTDGSFVSTTSTTTSVNLIGTFNLNIDYTIRVTATNTGGTSSAGTAGSTVKPYAVTIPGAVTNVTANAVNSGSVNLSWSAPSTGGAYSTFYITDDKGLTGTTTVNSGTTSKTINASYAVNTNYTFSVYTSNVVGSGGTGTSSAVQPYTVVPPNAVTSLVATAVDTANVGLTWSLPVGGGPIDSITITSTPAVSGGITYSTTPSSTSATISGAYASTQAYTFTVTTNNAGGTGSATSNSVTPKIGLLGITATVIGAGGGGGWFTGAGAGSYGANSAQIATFGDKINIVVGAGGAGSTLSGTPGGGGGLSSIISDSGYINLALGGGGGGQTGTTSNRGSGGNGVSYGGGTGNAYGGGGGGGYGSAGGNSTATSTGTGHGGNGGSGSTISTYGGIITNPVCTGGGGKGTAGNNGTGPSYTYGSGGPFNSTGLGGIVILYWTTIGGPTSITTTGSPSITTDATYTYYTWTSSGSIVFN